MKRTLSLVLALVMVLGMIPVYAQAATPQEEAGKLLEQLGVLKGDQNGNLMLNDTLLRRDAVVMLARLLGEEEVAAKYPTAPTWKDVTIKYYVPFLGWAQAEGYYKGYNDAKFGFTDDITVQDYAQVLLRALGYTDVEWKDAYTKAKDLGLLEGLTLEATAKLPRGNMAVMTVTALNTKVKDTEKTLAETLGIEIPADIALTAKATGAKKITVTFNKAVDKDKAVIEIARGTVKPTVKSTTWSADNKSAIVEFNGNLVAGDYTVKVTGLTDEALTTTLKVEAAKLTTIEIKGDILAIDKDNKKQARVGVVAKNQYGEEVSAAGLNISSSKGTGVISNGILTLTAGTDFTVGEKVTVTIVDSTTGVAGVKTLTVAYGVQVGEITIGELTTVDKNLVDKPINATRLNNNIDKYYIPVEIKDVAGNVLTAAELNKGNVEIITSNKQILNPNGFITTADGKTAIGLKAAETPKMAGTVVITVVSYGTGKTASATLKVVEDAKIDSVTVSAPATDLKQSKTVTLPVTVVDTYGNELALKDVEITNKSASELSFNTDEATLSASSATLSVKMNYATGVKTIEITPDPTATQVSLTSISKTGKVQTLTLSVMAKPYPVEIKGMGSDFVSVLANTTDAAVSTNIDDNIVFLDQYGEEIYVPYATPNSDGYYYTVTPTSGSATQMAADTTVKVKAAATEATDKYTINLMKNGVATLIDTLDVSVQVVNLDKISEFVINDMYKVYTGTADRVSGHNQEISVYGMYNGKIAAVPQSVIVAVSDNAGLTVATGGDYKTTAGAITNGADKTATITVLVSNNATSKTLTKEVVYSDAAPKAQSIAAYSNGIKKTTEINITTSGSVTFDLNNISSSNSIYFKATDQYGVARVGSAMRYAVTDVNGTTGFNAVVSTDGKLTVSGTGSFVLSAFCDGLMTQIQVNVRN